MVVQTNLERIPKDIAGYTSVDDSFPDSVYQELNADKHVYRHYNDKNGTRLDLYIGYYGTAKGGRTGHNPNACLPGAGWAIVDSKTEKIRNPVQQSTVPVNYVHARSNGINTVMLHWYQTGGTKVMSTGFQQNIERLQGRLLRNRNDGAFIQITAQVSDDKVAEAGTNLRSFAENVIQLLPAYWPVEK